MIEPVRTPIHHRFAGIDRVMALLVGLGVISSLLIVLGLLWKIDTLKGVGTLFATGSTILCAASQKGVNPC